MVSVVQIIGVLTLTACPLVNASKYKDYNLAGLRVIVGHVEICEKLSEKHSPENRVCVKLLIEATPHDNRLNVFTLPVKYDPSVISRVIQVTQDEMSPCFVLENLHPGKGLMIG